MGTSIIRFLYLSLLLYLSTWCLVHAATYEVGPDLGQLTNIADVPWATLNAGDTVLIHWRATPYKEKWVICRQGTASQPITVRGVANGSGDLPIIDGNDAVTPLNLSYWGEERSVIKIGGASTPSDTTPQYIQIENLEIRSARPAYNFTNDSGASANYANNAASIYIEKGQHITISDCIIHDSGNGIFCGVFNGTTQNITIEGCYIYDNGISGSFYEHNTYTAAVGITYQHNRFGPLRSGCLGNNLKDRSVGLVVRYNWIQDGNRQLDLVDCEDDTSLTSNPDYRSTYVYGNVFLESNSGNRQIIHYGGDSGDTSIYRKGTLYLYNNTLYSTRTDRTTLLRLSTNDESCDARNNIIYVTNGGSNLSMLDGSGTLDLQNNWLNSSYIDCFGTLTGSVNDNGDNLTGSDPGFLDSANLDLSLNDSSVCLDAGTSTGSTLIDKQYVKHQSSINRPNAGTIDIGAFERPSASTRRRITIILPNDYDADIWPSGTSSESGNTRIFEDLNTTDQHSIDITASAIN